MTIPKGLTPVAARAAQRASALCGTDHFEVIATEGRTDVDHDPGRPWALCLVYAAAPRRVGVVLARYATSSYRGAERTCRWLNTMDEGARALYAAARQFTSDRKGASVLPRGGAPGLDAAGGNNIGDRRC